MKSSKANTESLLVSGLSLGARGLFVAVSLLASAPLLAGCLSTNEAAPGEETSDEGDELSERIKNSPGTNGIDPLAISAKPLQRKLTNKYGIMTAGSEHVAPLCAAGTANSSGCKLDARWAKWRDAEAGAPDALKALVRCALPDGFQVTDTGETTLHGMFGKFTDFESKGLSTVEEQEQISACAIALVNRYKKSVNVCLVGPGDDYEVPCSEKSFVNLDGSFFGNLFTSSPVAYASGETYDASEQKAFNPNPDRVCDDAVKGCAGITIVKSVACQGWQPIMNPDTGKWSAEAYCPSFKGPDGHSYSTSFTVYTAATGSWHVSIKYNTPGKH